MMQTIGLALFLAACGGDAAHEGHADAAHEGHANAAHADKSKPAMADKGHDAHAGHDHAADAVKMPAFHPIPGAKVRFESPADGATVASPVALSFLVEGATVKPAGTMDQGTGHHHLIVDGGPIAAGTVVPANATHIHFGKGQTATSVELEPGEHSLTLQFADGLHRSYGEALSTTIKVNVSGS